MDRVGGVLEEPKGEGLEQATIHHYPVLAQRGLEAVEESVAAQKGDGDRRRR
jgi:hypothetical protein